MVDLGSHVYCLQSSARGVEPHASPALVNRCITSYVHVTSCLRRHTVVVQPARYSHPSSHTTSVRRTNTHPESVT